jgi:Metallo-peptidase family M12
MTSLRALPVLLSAVAMPGLAQDPVPITTLPFPAAVSVNSQEGVLELDQERELIEILHGTTGSIVLAGVPLPHGHLVDLELERLAFDPRDVGVHVNGRKVEHDHGDLSLWMGGLAGVKGTTAFLAFSSRGSYGWIHDGVDVSHISAMPGPDGDWSSARMRMYTNAALDRVGTQTGPDCQLDDLDRGPRSMARQLSGAGGDPQTSGALLDCKMAVETDFQLFQLWGDLDAEVNYVMALIGAVSARYEQQIDVRITFPYVQFYTTANDPWTSQDSGGGAGDLLGEFQSAWLGNLPAGANLAHFLSGAGLGGGVAWVGVLCNTTYGFAVSGNINGGVTFPVTQGSNTWDFFVMAHESGHNFGSLHTHNYCPPLDECADNCNGVINCTNQGTNLSYCHGCSGGMNNITTYFHPTVGSVMRAAADASCLPLIGGGTPTVLFADDFESGDLLAGGWLLSNNPSQVRTDAAREGTYGVRIRRKRWIQQSIDATGYSGLAIELWRKTKNYDAGERLRIRVHDGTSWYTLEDATNPGWGKLRFELGTWADNNPNLRLRLRSTGNAGNERGDVDSVVITGQ